jgi:hypothetical protein
MWLGFVSLVKGEFKLHRNDPRHHGPSIGVGADLKTIAA